MKNVLIVAQEGVRIDEQGNKVEVENEMGHFYKCSICGQYVDMRSLSEVLHHEEPDHDRIKIH